MSIVLQHDSRANVTYAYHNIVIWDKVSKKQSTSRILIGKLDPETGEIVKSSGKRRKKQIDEAVIDAEIAEYNKKIREKKKLEQDILSDSSTELQTLKKEYAQLQRKYEQFGQIMTSFANSITRFFEEPTQKL